MTQQHVEVYGGVDTLGCVKVLGHSPIRCLKRYVAREVYTCLQHPKPAVDRSRLRPRRQSLGLPLRAAAEHLHRPLTAITRIETGIVHDADLSHRYDDWLTTQGAA